MEQNDKDIKEERSVELKSEEIQEIITSVPSWIIRTGTTFVFLVLVLIIILSSVIRYPDIISTELRINSLNSPKPVFARQTGKIVTLLVKEGGRVFKNQPLAYMESIANHKDVLRLQQSLMTFSKRIKHGEHITDSVSPDLQLGELQKEYEIFYEEYLNYLSVQDGGYYTDRKLYLQKDLLGIKQIEEQLKIQQQLQEQENDNNAQEFEAYKILFQKKMVSKSEYKQQENKYLASKFPLQSTATAFLTNNSSYLSKRKEMMELEHFMKGQQSKFVQALGSMISQTCRWLNLYVLRAPSAGFVTYGGVLQEDQTVNVNQELFLINPSDTNFFGEIEIPQYNMGKVKIGQTTLVKMHSYPFEQYGIIKGKINFIADAAIQDSLFFAKVSFQKPGSRDANHEMKLKNGMKANAQIITEECTLLGRFIRNMTVMINH